MTKNAYPMTSTRPYLLRAFFDWILDNRLTPYVVVDAREDHVQVPMQYVDNEGNIILNISPVAVQHLSLENDVMEFSARFSGHAMHIYVPIQAIRAIYAKENGRGIVFAEGDDASGSTGDVPSASNRQSEDTDPPPSSPPTRKKGGKPPYLRVVK